MAMKAALVFLALMASAPAVSADAANPLGKVIELMDGLAAKVTKEGEAEAVAYAEFVEWCDDVSKNAEFQIKTAASSKDKLEATIAKAGGDIDAAATKIEDLASSIASSESDLKDATKVRDSETSDFAASEAKLLETTETISRAVAVLSREAAKNPAALAQVDTSNFQAMVKSISAVIDAAAFDSADKTKLTALVQENNDADDEELGGPAGAAYKSKGGSIIDVLEDMKEKAEEQLAGLRKAEDSAKHNYAMLKQSLEDQLTADNKELAAVKAARAGASETKATAEGDLASTVKELANAKKALETASADCMTTAADHEATVAARTAELKVIAQAKKIITDTTSGAADRSYSLIQLHSRADLKNNEVVALVKRLAKEHHSAALTQLASRIGAVVRYGGGEDIFGKVKSLITDMISKLQKEAEGDATEKAYCDEQMSETAAKKTELEVAVDKLSTKIDQASSKSAGLKEEVKELQANLAALASQQSEMDKIRREQNVAYTAAKSDLELGISGLRRALSVLRDYYGSAALLQQPSVPEHSQATDAGQSIISILEVCESDFAKDLTAEEMAEDDSASEYEKMTQENTLTKAVKDQDVKYKSQEFAGLDKSVAELTADRDTEQDELGAVSEYSNKINERCIAKPESYADQAKRRESEIAGLKQALTIIEDETVFAQKGKRGVHTGFLSVHQ